MISRRHALSTIAGSVALTSGLSIPVLPAFSSQPDPCLAFVNAWNSAMAENEAIAEAAGTDKAPDAHWKAEVGAFFERADKGDVPNATTAEGAAAALHRVLDWEDMQEQDASLIRAALAFLEGRH